MKRQPVIWLSAFIVILAVPTHLIGLLGPSIYRDPAVLLPQNRGTDLVTLAIAIPLLAFTATAVARGSLRFRPLWLGALAYLVYAYSMYAMAVRWNPLFLVYVALFSLSLFTLIIGLVQTNALRVSVALAAPLPVRTVAAYLIGIGVIVAAMWLAEEVRALVSGTIPPSVLQFETPTNIVHVFDLGVVLPAMILAAAQLLRRRPWGIVLAGMLLVKATTIGAWVVAMIWLSAGEGFATPPVYTLFFLALTVAGAALVWRLLGIGRLEHPHAA